MSHSASDFADFADPLTVVSDAPPRAAPALEVGDPPAALDALEADALGESPRSAGLWARLASPWLVSLVAHLSSLLALAFLLIHESRPTSLPGLIATFATDAETPDWQAPLAAQPETVELPREEAAAPQNIEVTPTLPLEDPLPAVSAEQPTAGAPREASSLFTPLAHLGGGLGGRTSAARAALVARRGGSQASEAAVSLGLQWLAEHQLDDGSWRLNHQHSPRCNGMCRNPGNIGSTTAATALALLPFLGAGSTHREGQFQEVVEKGIYYLGSRMILTEKGGDLQEGTMYAQGLATLALCEAYALTDDEALRPYCQAAIDFIVSAQHAGGGWRYMPGQAGDMTSFGWQLMALKSGQLGRMRIPSPTFILANEFLDSVQTEQGAYYGYRTPGKNPTMTAIGLLSRMYLGWPREHEALARGVELLAEQGPSDHDMYYNYYATQVMHHYEGGYFVPWNKKLRDYLIAHQATEGHEAGSWFFDDPKTNSAGRLYNTAMALLTLEVYYRYLPLYTPQILTPP